MKTIPIVSVILFVLAALSLATQAGAGSRRSQDIPGWGNPGGCYYGANSKCWVYSHPADQGRTSCQVLDISADPGHTGPNTVTRSSATEIANIAVGEGYQWAGEGLRNAPSCRT